MIHMLHWLYGTYMVLCINALRCPSNCSCPTDQQVMCTDAGYDSLPTNIRRTVTNLDLSGNHLTDITVPPMVHLQHIVELKLKSNEIGIIEDNSFHMLAELQTLDLSENELVFVHQGTFSGALKLLHLDLSANKLERIDGAFAELHMLNRLDLRNNKIKSLTQFSFRDLTSLKYLLLANNQINHLDPRAFRNLNKLMYLVLKGNPIGNADNIDFGSNLLSYIDLSECGLRYVPRGLPNSIRYLQLRRNNMTQIHRQDLAEVPYVSILVLDENGLTHIEDGTFAPMIYLMQLWLNGNKLTSMPKPLPSSLQRLLMDSNQIGAVMDIFPEDSKLATISLMGNNITYISPFAFRRLKLLQSLDLSNNLLQSLYSESFLNSSKLETLQLSKNPLTYFYSHCFTGLESLETLTLAYVHSNATLHDNIFDGLVNLHKLDLDSSPGIIESVFSSEPMLDALSGLEDLSMLSAELTTLRPDFPDLLPDLRTLHISSTRWHCDTNIRWFRDWLLSTDVNVDSLDQIVCFSPQTLYELPIIGLEESDFVPATTVILSTALRTFPPVTTLKEYEVGSGVFTNTHSLVTPQTFEVETFPPFDGSDFYIDKSALDPDAESSGSGSNEDISSQDLSTEDSEFPDNFWEHFWTTPQSIEHIHSINQNTNHYQNISGIQINTLPNDIKHHIPSQIHDPAKPGQPRGSKMWIVIIVCTITAILIAIIVIVSIVVGCKRHNSKDIYANAVKYNNRNDILYFTPEPEGVDGSLTNSLKKDMSKEQISLVPGRDINHEGPLRMYKWEDF